MAEPKTITFEDATIIFRNFAGKEGQYNREGDRNFGVIVPHEDAENLIAQGWNIKFLKPRDEGEEPTPYLPVTVGYKAFPPRITMITSRARTVLTEENLDVLDWAEFQTVDLVVRAYEWTVNGKSGFKAYLKTLFVTLAEDDLERKYAVNDLDGDR